MELLWRIADTLPGGVRKSDIIDLGWLEAPAELKAEHARLTRAYNTLIDAHNARIKAANAARAAERERLAVRAEMCPQCFTIHAGECL
jgi:hypothetical protein